MADLGDVGQALAPYAEAEAIFLELGPNSFSPDKYLRIKGQFAQTNATLAHHQGHYQEAKMKASESVRLFEAGGDRWRSFGSWIQLGQSCLDLGEYAPARDHFLEALALLEESGDNRKAYVLRWLGMVDLSQGNLDRALEYCRTCLNEAAPIPDYNIVASCLGLFAGIAAKQSQPARAATLSGAAQALYANQRRSAWEDSTLDTLLPGWHEGPAHEEISIAFEAGTSLNAEQAAAYALGVPVV